MTIAYAHPDDVIAVFDHPAIWINGTAIQIIGVSWQLTGSFRIVDMAGGVTIHLVPCAMHGSSAAAPPPYHGWGSSCSLGLDRQVSQPGFLYDGQSAAWCLDQYESMQRDEPTVDLSISLTTLQLHAARVLWSEKLRGLVGSV